MTQSFRTRFWVEAGMILTAALAVITQVWPDWIELVFRMDPDHGNGSVERVIVGVCLVAFLVSVLAAGTEFRSHASQSS